MGIGVIYIHIRLNTHRFQLLHILQRLGVERLPVADKRVAGWKTVIIGLLRGRGIR